MIPNWFHSSWPDIKQCTTLIAVLFLLVAMAESSFHARYLYRSCSELHEIWPDSCSGEYQFRNSDDEPFWAFCQFEGDHGYMYFSREDAVALDLDQIKHSTDKVMVKHLRTNSKQYDTLMENIATTPAYNLSVQYNANVDYKGSINGAAMGPELFLGFLPSAYAANRNRQGYKANGQEFDFSNCDSNPNSYMTFLYNVDRAEHNGYGYNCCYSYPLMRDWIDVSTLSTTCLPWHYFFQYEMHFGGCGGYAINGYGTVTDIMGAALGLHFGL